jgi:V8-like Glu-specific endopeptidase
MRKLSISLLAAFLLTSTLTAVPSTANPKGSPNVNAVGFWNSEKINNAIAFDMVFEQGAKSAKRVPSAKGTGKPAPRSTSNVLGNSWTKGGLPLTASGKVFFSIGTLTYQCSGALVQDGDINFAIVLTAGHCVYDNASGYVQNWIFIPSYDIDQVSSSGCSASTNCWQAERIIAHSGFTSETSFTTQATRYDWGFAKITERKNGALPDGDGTNAFPAIFNALSANTPVNSFGYPAAGKYNGRDLVYSSGALTFDSRNGNQTYALASDMTAGCSGGPWLSSLQNKTPYNGVLVSVNSYKYGTTTFIYGPKFSSETQSTFDQAKSNS